MSEKRQRPSFARNYPESLELDGLLEAFDRGDMAHVREHAPQLAKQCGDERIALAALDLRRRIGPSSAAGYLWGLGLALVVGLYGYYLSEQPSSTTAPAQDGDAHLHP